MDGRTGSSERMKCPKKGRRVSNRKKRMAGRYILISGWNGWMEEMVGVVSISLFLLFLFRRHARPIFLATLA